RARLAGMSLWTKSILLAQKVLLGRYPRYHAVVSTSQRFIDAAFKRSFKAHQFISTGYPRNDLLLNNEFDSHRLLKINVDHVALEALEVALSKGFLVALYVPTFRKHMNGPFGEYLDLGRLSEYACHNNILFIIKLHPVMMGERIDQKYPNLIEYESL